MIVFVGCGATKRKKPCKAEDMYIGQYFKQCMLYAKTLTKNNNIYILSAKYGVLPLNKVIEPYNKTLKTMSKKEIKEWASMVVTQLQELHITSNTPVTFICGKNYYEPLTNSFTNITTPLPQGGMGYQIQFMQQQVKNNSHHKLF